MFKIPFSRKYQTAWKKILPRVSRFSLLFFREKSPCFGYNVNYWDKGTLAI